MFGNQTFSYLLAQINNFYHFFIAQNTRANNVCFVCTHRHRWLLKSRAQNGEDIAKNHREEQEEKRWTSRLFFGVLFVVVVVVVVVVVSRHNTHQNPF